MTYYVSVENGVANHYTASVTGWLDCVAEETTREEAIAEHTWVKFAGMYQNNPLFDEVLDSIQAYRRQLDADENVI